MAEDTELEPQAERNQTWGLETALDHVSTGSVLLD